MKLIFQTTYFYQIEILPRLTIMNFKYTTGIAFEWLFWSVLLFKDVDEED